MNAYRRITQTQQIIKFCYLPTSPKPPVFLPLVT